MQQRDDEAGAAHAERMAERDRAAVDVHALLVEAELAHDREALRGERLVQLDQVEVARPSTPVRASSLRTAGIGPMPITRGSTPATALPTKRANGSAPSAAASLLARDHERRRAVVDAARVARRDACRPAGTPAAAWRAPRPSCPGAGARRPRRRATATSSSAKRPAACAAAQRCCERSANASWSSRADAVALGHVLARLAHALEREHRLHGRVREAPAERAVVEHAVAARERARRACPSPAARGSSTPRRRPRTGRPRPRARHGTPRRSPRGPEAHSRLTVTPATDCGRPASSTAMRATLRLSSPAWLAQPKYTSSISPGSTPARSTAAAIAIAARSSGRTCASAPP